MITVVTYLWGLKYRPGHVERLARSVARWLTVPHRFVCVTDAIVPGVQTLKNPPPPYPRCFRRLWLFSPEARSLGHRILHLDLDVVVCGPLDPLVTRGHDFTIYRAGSCFGKGWTLNPSVFVLTTGTQDDLWLRWRKGGSALAARANADGFWGSDQAVISYLRQHSGVDTIGDAEGVVSFRRIRSEHLTAPPEGTRIVSFHGKRTPFERSVQQDHPWIRSAWQEAA